MGATVVHAHLAPVELVDGEDAAEVDRRAPADRPPSWLRRHAAWVAGASAAAVLALVAVQGVLDAHERERLEYLADVPGVLSPLHDPPGTLRTWTPSAGSLVAADSAGHWAIGARYHLGGVDLRATDPDSGDVLWSVPFSLDDALPPGGRSEFPSVWVRCTTTTSPDGPRAVCAAEVSPARPGGAVTPLLVLDPESGTTLATTSLAPGSLWSVTAAHLVVATPQRDSAGAVRWTLTATDPATGDVQWRQRTPRVPEVHAVRLGDRVIRSAADLASDDDRVLLTDSGHAWLFGADGKSRGDVTVETDGWAELARAGTVVWSPWQAFAFSAGVLVTRDGTRTPVAERPARLAVDDGSAPDVALLTDSEDAGLASLVGRDATTGEELWRLTGTTGQALLVDGVVHVAQGRDVRALDARTGATHWVTHVDAPPVYLGTDGSLVVVVTADRTLRGLDRSDGKLASVADVARHLARDPGGVDQVSEYAGRLLVRFRDGSGILVG
ncbi:outer membrane protein assembly factor BamB family protein [Cellulomonas sp. P5_C5]